jgi:SNF2 family DNA or RNA helicase
LTGSLNFTNKGYGDNIENVNILGNWFSNIAVINTIKQFDDIWNNHSDLAVSLDFNNEIRDLVINVIKNSGGLSKHLNKVVQEFTKSKSDFFDYLFSSPFYSEWNLKSVSLMPHQKRVITEALSSFPVRSIIADEVGLGKTIESSFIIHFLMKYYDAKKVLLVVPAVLKKQWQEELFQHFGIKGYIFNSFKNSLEFKIDRFEEEFILKNREELLNFKKSVIIVSSQFIRIQNEHFFSKISDSNRIDLLMVDEAHAARLSLNDKGIKEGNKLYKVLKKLEPFLTHKLLLTATPFQTNNYDYLGLLELVSGMEFEDDLSLKRISKINYSDPLTTNEKIQAVLELIEINGPEIFGVNVQITSSSPAHELLNHYSEEIYIKNHITTRFTLRNTRQNLVNNGYVFPDVALFSEPLNFTDEIEDTFSVINNYIENLLFAFEKYTSKQNNGFGFVKSIYSQRLVSSFYACKNTLERRKEYLEKIKQTGEILYPFDVNGCEEESYDFNFNVHDINETVTRLLEDELAAINSILRRIDAIFFNGDGENDPKVIRCLEIVDNYSLTDQSILIFSRFTSTTNYIVQSLIKKGYVVGQYQGNCKRIHYSSESFDELSKEEISLKFKSKSIKILVCSDAASEGLNLQTASVLINVDVPWNPARLLQRFGRIDRFGQKAKELYFYNLIYPNSIEDRMYSRLHGRNVQFREILGNTPEVVTADYYNNLVDDSIYQIDNNYDLQFKNSRVRISDNDKLSLSEFILDKLKSRSDLVVLENQILYNSLLYEYSLSSFESDFLNVFHPLVQEIIVKNLEGIDLKFIVNKDKQNVMPIWLSGNSSFQLCRKEELISLLIAPDNFDQGSLVSFDLNNTDLLSEIKSCLNYVGDIINPFESFNEFIRIDFFDELHLS